MTNDKEKLDVAAAGSRSIHVWSVRLLLFHRELHLRRRRSRYAERIPELQAGCSAAVTVLAVTLMAALTGMWLVSAGQRAKAYLWRQYRSGAAERSSVYGENG